MGGAMGIDISDMSIWEIRTYWAGFAEARGADVDAVLTDAEVEDLARWVDA